MKKTIILIALICIFFTGCVAELTSQKEIAIENGKKNCNEIEKSLISSMLKEMAKQDCVKVCEEKAYNYSRWNCTDDKVVCVCVKK